MKKKKYLPSVHSPSVIGWKEPMDCLPGLSTMNLSSP